MATSIAVAMSMVAPKALDCATSVDVEESAGSTAVLKDRRRTWLWAFLAVLALSQIYFVREILVAFAFFAIAFAAVTFVGAGLYMLVKCGEVAVARIASIRQHAMQLSRIARDSRKPA
ncbi:MAG: hypothetical protein ACRD51_10275 [Candidatus Acidiferrum sp.]